MAFLSAYVCRGRHLFSRRGSLARNWRNLPKRNRIAAVRWAVTVQCVSDAAGTNIHQLLAKRDAATHMARSALFLGNRLYKYSAVAEMGDRLATVDMGRKLGEAVPILDGELGPYM